MKYITDINVDKVYTGVHKFIRRSYTDQEKKKLVKYLRSFETYWATTAHATDPFTGEELEVYDVGYFDGEYTWYEMEIYCLEKYDLALTDGFLNKVLNKQKK